jgi:serine/threonine-protein kinase
MSEVQPGDVLAGKYRVEHVLGEGGMGLVVSATHLALDERVALKFMRADALGRDDGVQRFLREARAAVRLKSEHVARVLDVGTLDTGAPYIVMEHLEGSDLSDVLAARGTLPLAEAVDYVLQACDAIAEAHARGIIHRDLKPGNLFVARGRDGAPLVKVLDFGISKVNTLGDRPDSMTSSAAILGSPVYMSPEQMQSSRDVDGTTDIWSLGVILYEAVGGRVPFDEQTIGALMAKVLTQPPPSLATLRDLPPAFVSVVAKCLEKEPARRYQTVADLARELAPFGDAGSLARVARILAMPVPANEGLVPPTVVSPMTRDPSSAPPARPSILGVAATLDVNGAAPGSARPSPSVRGPLVYGLVGVAIASLGLASFFALRPAPTPGSGSPPSPAGMTSGATPGAAPAASAAGQTASALPTAPAAPAASEAPTSPPPMAASSPSVVPAASAPRRTTPPGGANRPSTSTPRPAPSGRGTSAPSAPDPFGTNRE